MTTVQDILTFLNTKIPGELAMNWDNTGFQVGDRTTPVQKILVALDPFEGVCQEAAQFGAQLLVTHHPLLFLPTSDLTEDSPVGRCVRILMRSGISQWSAHTNLDVVSGGVNDVLAQVLGLSHVEVLPPENLLRVGVVEQIPLKQFLAHVKERLGCPVLRYADGGKPCRRIAVGGGACASDWKTALDAGCDTFVTADIKYNQFWDAADHGLNLIDAGHFYTENPVCTYLAQLLREQFPQIEVRISRTHKDCMLVF